MMAMASETDDSFIQTTPLDIPEKLKVTKHGSLRLTLGKKTTDSNL
jgi:hypothetical protein